jgi:hypothetical protein
MGWYPGIPCAPVASVLASSGDASEAADFDLRTRWVPESGSEAWLVYDLGRKRDVSGISVVWYARHSSPVELVVELSRRGNEFAEVDRGLLEGVATNTTLRTFLPQQARYVRVKISAPEGVEVPSVYEVGVHAEGEERRAAK